MAAQKPASGRPWFVRYANPAVSDPITTVGSPFGVPFQPTNEPQELVMQADPLMFKEFPTQQAAAAWIASATGQKDLGFGAGPASAAREAVTSASPLGALFQKAIWIRAAEVLVGLVLIGIGLNAMLKGRPLSLVTSAAGLASRVVPA
jgi:hypothetical protein